MSLLVNYIDGTKYNIICSCGFHKENSKDRYISCPECNTTNIHDIDTKVMKRTIKVKEYDVPETGKWGFILERYTDTYVFTGTNLECTDRVKTHKLVVDWRNKKYCLYDHINNTFNYDIKPCDIARAFKSMNNLRNIMIEKVDKQFIDILKNYFIYYDSYYCNYPLRHRYSITDRHADLSKILLAYIDCDNRIKNIIDVLYGILEPNIIRTVYETGVEYTRRNENAEKTRWAIDFNIDSNTPQGILKLPKQIIKCISTRDGLTPILLYNLRIICNEVPMQKILDFIENIDRFRSDNLQDDAYYVTLHNLFDTNFNRLRELFDFYKNNYDKFFDYFFNELYQYQGITPDISISILYDYYMFCKELKINMQRYPKSLKKEHDVLMKNMKVIKHKEEIEKFQNIITDSNYKKMTYKNDKYTIIIPNKSTDLIREGQSLSHCVGTYVKKVINGECKIVFMRNLESIDDPLITIEVRDRRVVQCRGFSNRNPTSTERSFIDEWQAKVLDNLSN